jgi:hypothetical protein
MLHAAGNLAGSDKVNMLPCLFKQTFHMDCPGCGFQRSAAALLKGEWLQSFQSYPALVPILCLAVITALHLGPGLKHGAAIIRYLQIGIGIIIAVFYIYKVITLKAFN